MAAPHAHGLPKPSGTVDETTLAGSAAEIGPRIHAAVSMSHGRPTILSIDDDAGTRQTVTWALSLSGLNVVTASSGAEGLSLARRTRFDLILVDQRLPDILGTDLLRALRNETSESRLILLSGFLTTAITVEAMKLGAVNVMEKPVTIDELVAIVWGALREPVARTPSELTTRLAQPASEISNRTPSAEVVRPGSAAERWAMLVLKACESVRDLKTLEDWALFAGVSYSSLRESCHLMGIPPHDARDLTRVLRALLASRRHGCSPDVLLDVSDSRTLEKLLHRAGLSGGRAGGVTPAQFLRRQRFVPRQNLGLRFLGFLLARGACV